MWTGIRNLIEGFVSLYLGIVCLASVIALTQRESEVLERVAAGATSKEIAKQLRVSETTVKFHVANALRKLNARSRTEAVAIAVATGQITAPKQRPRR